MNPAQTDAERVAKGLTEAQRAALHSGFIAHDRARYQLQQVITILGSEADTLVTLLEQVRDAYDVLPTAVRRALATQAEEDV